jgi:hypothetical protein
MMGSCIMAKLVDGEGGAVPGRDSGAEAAVMDEEEVAFAQRMMEDGAPGDRKEDDPKTDAGGTESEEDEGGDEGGDEDGDENTDEDGDEDTDEDGDGDKKEKGKSHALTPEQQARVDARIGKEVRRRKEAEEERTEARERVAELETQVAELRRGATAQDGPAVMQAQSEDEIEQREEFLQEVIDFCEENRGQDVFDEEKGAVAYTADQVADRLRQARRELRMIPRARKALEQRQQEDAEAAKVWPDLGDPSTELSKAVKAVLRDVPQLAVVPKARLLVADALAMRKQREKAGKGAVSRPAAPAAPTPTAGNRGPADSRSGKKKSFETFAQSGYSEDALAAALDG